MSGGAGDGIERGARDAAVDGVVAGTVTELARAKVNLTLKILGKRPDGYHELESLVAFADVGDIITLVPGTAHGVAMRGPFAGAITGENIVDVALRKLARDHPNLMLGRVIIDKHLPVAAGLGGGSANAAAVLRAVRRANPGCEAAIDWMGIARCLGADVPVCLVSEGSWMTGLGERVVKARGLPGLSVVLVNPMREVPADKTARVFRALSAPPLPDEPRGTDEWQQPPGPFGEAADLIAFMAGQGNDLEAPARGVLDGLAAAIDALRATAGCLHAAASGAGPTAFGVFARGEARAAADAVAAAHPTFWVRVSRLG